MYKRTEYLLVLRSLLHSPLFRHETGLLTKRIRPFDPQGSMMCVTAKHLLACNSMLYSF